MTNWPWLVIGDFNELFQEEKRGGDPVSLNKSLTFADMISNFVLMELGSWIQSLPGQTLGGLVTTLKKDKKDLTEP